MRILVVCRPEPGHVLPIANVAEWLLEDGHEVGWVSSPAPEVGVAELPVDARGRTCLDPLVDAGVERIAPPPVELPSWYRRPARPATLVEHLAALQAESRAFREVMPAPVEALRRVIAAFRPDALAIDPSCAVATFAAERERVPYAHVHPSLEALAPHRLAPLCTFAEDPERMAETYAIYHRWLSEYGLAGRERGIWYTVSPWLNTVFTTESFVGEDRLWPARTHLVGPSYPRARRGDDSLGRDFPWHRLAPKRPLVYASFGSQLPVDGEVVRSIAEAAAPLGAQVVFSLPGGAPALRPQALPGDTLVVPYAPQRELLERAALCVTHGGANSVMEALWAGVPLLVAPMFADNPIQAHFVASSGVGLALDVGEGADAWRASMAALLAPGSPWRVRARALRADYRGRDGARDAARLIVQLAARVRGGAIGAARAEAS